MKKAILCCISCILPCGALDVIRIVHSNGKVEEITRNHVRAADIIKSYPNHVLKKPNSDTNYIEDVSGSNHPKIVIVPPSAELQRGKIYFLVPVPVPVPAQKTSQKTRKKKDIKISQSNSNDISTTDRYLTDIMSEKLSVKRRGRAGVWRPRLESITETATEVYMLN